VRARSRGFALTAPIFLLVVIAALGVYVATVSSVGQFTSVFSLRGSQAYFAARAGLEWAFDRLANAGGAGLGCGGAPVTFSLAGGAAAGYSVTVSCSSQVIAEGAASYTAYAFTARASSGTPGTPGYVARTLVATAIWPPPP